MSDLLGTLGEFATFGLYDHESSGDIAAAASGAAANLQAGSQREALDYMKEREALPRQFSEGALKGLGGVYGLEGGTGSQQDLINRAISSPLYGAIMGGQKAGEESILRSASATGGLRSGNVQANMYDFNTQLQNKALLESYNQQLTGLQGMAGLQNNTNAIAGGMSGIGQTLAQGQIAGAQAIQTGQQNTENQLVGLAGTALSYFSDRRLKNNLKKISEVKGHNWYTWDWNVVANKMGMNGKSEGVIADEIFVTDPDCVGFRQGFLTVNYNKLGIFKEVAHG